MSSDRQRNALQVIFAFFLGLMLTAFIGVGVNTFYPSPYQEMDSELQNLYQQQEDIEFSRSGSGELSAADAAELEQVREEIRALEDERQNDEQDWGRNTSIVLILFATLVMSISLIRSEELRIISNGLLLGGVFTMLYGTGWAIASGSSLARFGVMTFALAVTFGLGYARFVYSRAARPAAASTEGAALPSEAFGDIEARITALERRLAAAAEVFTEDKE